MSFIIFPNQLFEKIYIPAELLECNIYLVEEPVYFGDRDVKLNFNKIKLIWQRSAMKAYSKYLNKNNINHQYVEYKHVKKVINGIKRPIHIFDPVDHYLLQKYPYDMVVYDNPNFLLPSLELERINKKFKDKYNHTAFYSEVKKYLSSCEDLKVYEMKSYDKDNRKTIPKDKTIPKLANLSKTDHEYIKEATKYVERTFPNALDPFNGKIVFPVTHRTAKKWLKYFINEKYKNYGKYQDAIQIPNDSSDMYLFHSTISPMLNSGLLMPLNVIRELDKGYRNKKAGKDSYEGIMRQILGWREYQRLLYTYQYDVMKGSNYFNNKNKLSKKWYTAELGIDPVDDVIKQAFKYGYLHHILRLMVMGNFMNLCRISPNEVYKWFMEFSLDSYDWVMIQNIYGMAMWSDNGLSMRKPYITTDSYIISMSNYKSKEDWTKIWRGLFYCFLLDNEKKLKGTPFLRNLNYIKKQSKSKREEILQPGILYLKK